MSLDKVYRGKYLETSTFNLVRGGARNFLTEGLEVLTREAKLTLKNGVFVRYVAKFSPTKTQNFLRRGGQMPPTGGCSPLARPWCHHCCSSPIIAFLGKILTPYPYQTKLCVFRKDLENHLSTGSGDHFLSSPSVTTPRYVRNGVWLSRGLFYRKSFLNVASRSAVFGWNHDCASNDYPCEHDEYKNVVSFDDLVIDPLIAEKFARD